MRKEYLANPILVILTGISVACDNGNTSMDKTPDPIQTSHQTEILEELPEVPWKDNEDSPDDHPPTQNSIHEARKPSSRTFEQKQNPILRELEEESQIPAETFKPNPNLDLESMHITEFEKDNLKIWEDLIEKLALYYNWDANLAAAQMILESGGANGQTGPAGAVGLWGIMPGVNGRPDADTLMDPFVNGTWHFSIMIDLCKVQGDNLINSLARYNAGEANIESGMEYSHEVLMTAGYLDENGNPSISTSCERIERVPEPPIESELGIIYGE